MTFTSEPNLNPFGCARHHQSDYPATTKKTKMIIQQHHHQQRQQQASQPKLPNEPRAAASRKSPNQQTSTTNNPIDPVYLEDDEVFYNLIVKENSEQNCKQSTTELLRHQQQHHLVGQQRHLLLSWMLKVCEHEYCEDDIFSLATMILDKFLLFRPINGQQTSRAFNRRRRLRIKKVRKKPFKDCYGRQKQQAQVEHHQFYCNEYNNANNIPTAHHSSDLVQQKQEFIENNKDTEENDNEEEEEDDDDDDEIVDYDVRDEELRQRQLYLFAACSLLLASKLRQTPRLCIQILIEFSKLELPVELTREEMLDGELLILSSLKWDLGSLVTPNDFLSLILRKCHTLLEPFEFETTMPAEHPDVDLGERPHHHLRRRHLSSPSPLSSLGLEDLGQDQHGLGPTRSLIGRETSATTTILMVPNLDDNAPSALITPDSTPDEMIELQQRQQQQQALQRRLARCDEFKVKRHTQTLLELCLMDADADADADVAQIM